MTIQAWLTGTPEYLRQAQQGILNNSLTAAGNSLATALQLQTDFNVCTTVASSTGVALLGTVGAGTGPCLPGDTMIVVNHGANTLSVYPFAATGKIANGSAGAAFSVSATKTAYFTLISGGPDVWAGSVSA
jgi:hypothetical protein